MNIQPRSFDSLANTAPRPIAALPMYDLPEIQPANDALWAAIAARLQNEGLLSSPISLTRGPSLDAIWTDPGLLLGQSCGYPFATALQSKVRLLATPRYRAPGCAGPFYRSAIVVRRNSATSRLADLRSERCAVNDLASNSGMNLFRVEVAAVAQGAPFFNEVIVTGSHEASALAVAEGDADVAAIDCVTWAHLQRYRRATTDRLRVLMWTVRSPGLPLVTAAGLDQASHTVLRRILDAVEQDPVLADVRGALLLDGFNDLSAPQYHAVIHFERLAASQGYPQLA